MDDLKLVQPLKDIVLKTTPQTVSFECELNHPNRRVTWLKDGQPISIGKKFEFENVDNVYKLTIDKASQEDVGKISMTCAKIKTEAALRVESKFFFHVTCFI